MPAYMFTHSSAAARPCVSSKSDMVRLGPGKPRCGAADAHHHPGAEPNIRTGFRLPWGRCKIAVVEAQMRLAADRSDVVAAGLINTSTMQDRSSESCKQPHS